MKTLHISYFAILREQRGLSQESLPTTASNPRDLYEELGQRHRFSLPAQRVRVAVNGEFASWDVELRDGQQIAFIPPVAGG